MGNVQTIPKEFHWVGSDEPHASRRKEILAKYPQIRDLYGPDIRLLPCVVGLVLLQWWLASMAPQWPSWVFWFVAYSLGGTITHALSLANHELSHCLCFNTTLPNEMLGLFANLGQGLPSSITFKKYHLVHHIYQGHEGMDTDLPTEWEGAVFNTTLRKVLWCFLQPVFYAIRPLVVAPKPLRPMEFLNLLTVVAFNCFMAQRYGGWSVVYLCASTLLGMGLHPVAGHFIAEHYEFVRGQETYSYYGPLNWVCFNVGYHNEHHDFPKVSGFRLPEVKAIAPEYYDHRWKSSEGKGLVIHDSWVKVIYMYITDPSISPFTRVKRDLKKNGNIKSTVRGA
eukprot:comp12732_c0_seq1/m.7847 comp12732_c0_seq1/g.7847  ORF comp12732_c0_seq1/g.7847 comp12732_c0_seq1/m.7847 type:complete len:338 (-) comp12732_c0_seq1:528-1541(-)